MWPVFVFGTGRCGSTHVQRLITLSTRCWVWGEHGGFLEPLLDAVSRYETSQGLEQFVFSQSPRDEDRLVADMVAGSEMLSWLNQLSKDDFRGEVRSLVDRMFRRRLPKGWSEWGFKEIRYGLDNDTPAILLDLFPAATAAFTFRDPRATIESMIRTWSPDLLKDASRHKELKKAFAISLDRWRKIMTYFLNRRFKTGNKIVFISIDKLHQPPKELLGVLKLNWERGESNGLGITNPGPRQLPKHTMKICDELYEIEQPACLSLYAQACARSDADFQDLRCCAS